MDGADEATLAQLRRSIAPSHLIAASSRDIPGVIRSFQISCVVVAGETIVEPETLLAALPRTVPIERVFSRSVAAVAERLQRALER